MILFPKDFLYWQVDDAPKLFIAKDEVSIHIFDINDGFGLIEHASNQRLCIVAFFECEFSLLLHEEFAGYVLEHKNDVSYFSIPIENGDHMSLDGAFLSVPLRILLVSLIEVFEMAGIIPKQRENAGLARECLVDEVQIA